MLCFIYGLPRSGKTTEIFNRVKSLAENNKQSVIIVPEQASFETEKGVLKALGDSLALNVQVSSFSHLHDNISRDVGGISARVLKDSDRMIFMNKALRQVATELKIWRKYVNSLTFAKKMLDTVGEFKISAITCEDIRKAVSDADTESLKLKLNDLALIFETYDLLIAERYIDPVDKLDILYRNLETYHWFEGKNVFFDGFKGFTGQQYKIIERILSQAENVYVSFTTDVNASREFDIFTNIRSSVLKIEKIAEKHNKTIEKPIVLKTSYYNSDLIPKVERLLSDNETEENITAENSVTVCEADTVFDEAEFVARTIRKLVRTENYRYRDFVIIARDAERYSAAVEYACLKNKVECFIDKKFSLIDFPLSKAVLSAISALDFSRENILNFHKSGLNFLSVDEISKLENYTYLWNLIGEIWLKEWDMDVRGFVTETQDENLKSELKIINSIRKKAIKPLIAFKNELGGSAYDMSKSVVNLLSNCNAADSLKHMCENFSKNELFSADILKQSYDKFMNILDGISVCFGERTLKISEFYDTLNLAFSSETVSAIPQTIDQVIFGQADLIRPWNPKVAFILGANQGVFPKFSENASVFADKERKKLIDFGFNITDNQLYTSIDENFLVYCNLCCPSDKLYVSYAKHTLNGEELSPSSFVLSLKEKLSVAQFKEPQYSLSLQNLPETEDAAFSELCRRFKNGADFSTLQTAFSDTQNDKKIKNLIVSVLSEKNSISTQNAEKLYGKNLYMSATKFDTFNRCEFSYFCKYGLKLKKLQPADFDVLQRGTIVHFVLEKVISTYGKGIKDFSREKLESLCDYYIEMYLDSVIGYRTVENSRHPFLISKISRSLKEVLFHLSEEFAQSDFEPTHCELKIGGEAGIPLKFSYDGGDIFINGSIDRVDEYNGYIRVIDYKTGTKSFKLPDVLFGLNLQMLIYLYAVIRCGKNSDSNAAGIFYMPSKRDLNNEGMAMNGLAKADADLVYAMEKDNKGKFVPALSFNKDGTISKKSTSYISENDFSEIFDYIENLMKKTGNSIAAGNIKINPVDGRESSACDYCDYKAICGKEDNVAFRVPNLNNREVFERMEKGEEDGI